MFPCRYLPGALTALALVTSLVAALPRSAFAQHVTLTYLADTIDNNNQGEAIITKSFPVNSNGTVSGSINSDYIDDVSVANGSEFIVEPIVDPVFTLSDTLFNFSSNQKTFTSLRFAAGPGLYFDSTDATPFSNVFGIAVLEDPLGGTRFGTVAFLPNPTAPVPQQQIYGDSGLYTFTFHVPNPTVPPTAYTMEILPNGQPYQPLVPEPGAVATGMSMAGALGAALLRGKRRRSLRRR